MKRLIAIIGGGITGLSAAHRLIELRSDLDIVILEKSGRLGGTISTIRKKGFLIEEGPDSFITTKPWALDLSMRLGLKPELIETNEKMRRTMIVKGNELLYLPEGFALLAPTLIMPFLKTSVLSWKGKLRMMLDLFLPKKEVNDESLASFVRRRFGNEALIRIAEPMVSGIYTADPEELSLLSTMPQFLEMERKYGSIIKGMRRAAAQGKEARDGGARYSLFASFRNGMETLVEAITKNLPKESVKLNQKVKKIENANRGWRIITEDREIRCSGVIVTTPSHISGGLLEGIDPLLSSELQGIEYASSAVVTLAYKKESIRHGLDAFGFVVPAIEKRDLIACSFSSIKFKNRAPKEYLLARCFVGGSRNPAICQLDEPIIIGKVKKELERLLSIESKPEFAFLKRYFKAMPQYRVGHNRLVNRIRSRAKNHRGLELAGNAYDGIGLPDCISSGEKAAKRIIETFTS